MFIDDRAVDGLHGTQNFQREIGATFKTCESGDQEEPENLCGQNLGEKINGEFFQQTVSFESRHRRINITVHFNEGNNSPRKERKYFELLTCVIEWERIVNFLNDNVDIIFSFES